MNRNDPEARIFLNNARIGKQKSYTIATSVPIGTDPNESLEILRGVAQAQNEINASGGIKGVPLKVAIALRRRQSRNRQADRYSINQQSRHVGCRRP